MLDFIEAIVARAGFFCFVLFCFKLFKRSLCVYASYYPTDGAKDHSALGNTRHDTTWELTHPDPWPFYDGRKNIDVSLKWNTWNISSLSTLVSHHILILMENRPQRRLYWSGFHFASTVKVQPTSVAFKPLMLENKHCCTSGEGLHILYQVQHLQKNKKKQQTIKLSFAPRKGFLCLSLDFVVLYICFLSFWLFIIINIFLPEVPQSSEIRCQDPIFRGFTFLQRKSIWREVSATGEQHATQSMWKSCASGLTWFFRNKLWGFHHASWHPRWQWKESNDLIPSILKLRNRLSAIPRDRFSFTVFFFSCVTKSLTNNANLSS